MLDILSWSSPMIDPYQRCFVHSIILTKHPPDNFAPRHFLPSYTTRTTPIVICNIGTFLFPLPRRCTLLESRVIDFDHFGILHRHLGARCGVGENDGTASHVVVVVREVGAVGGGVVDSVIVRAARQCRCCPPRQSWPGNASWSKPFRVECSVVLFRAYRLDLNRIDREGGQFTLR